MLMPLAVLSGEYKTQAEAADLLSRIFDGLNEKLAGDQDTILNLWASTEILLGLKFKGKVNKKWIRELTRGKLAVRESVIYQDILEEGREEGREEGEANGRRAAIVKFCKKRFGQLSEGERIALEAITDLERLDRMAEQCDQVSTWYDLLQI